MHGFNFLFCCDNNYLRYLLVLVQSLFDNLSAKTFNKEEDTLTFHVIVDSSVDVPSEQDLVKSFLERNHAQNFAKFCFYNVDSEAFVNSVPFNKHGSRNASSAYYRLLAGDVLPDSVNEVLYLDIDTLICGDLIEIFNASDLSHRLFAAVRDLGILGPDLLVANKNAKEKLLGDKFYCSQEDLINSGVLLINLALWRKHRITELAISIANNYKTMVHDQSVLWAISCSNLLRSHEDFNGSVVEFLDPKFNFQQIGYLLTYNNTSKRYDLIKGRHLVKSIAQSAKEFEHSMANTVVAHFTNSKPWAPAAVREKHGICFVSHPYFDLYMAKWRVVASQVPEIDSHFTSYSSAEIVEKHLEVLHKKVRKAAKETYLSYAVTMLLFVLTWVAILFTAID